MLINHKKNTHIGRRVVRNKCASANDSCRAAFAVLAWACAIPGGADGLQGFNLLAYQILDCMLVHFLGQATLHASSTPYGIIHKGQFQEISTQSTSSSQCSEQCSYSIITHASTISSCAENTIDNFKGALGQIISLLIASKKVVHETKLIVEFTWECCTWQ